MKRNIVVKLLIISLVAVTTFFSMKAYDSYLSDNIFSYDELYEETGDELYEFMYKFIVENDQYGIG